MQSATTWQRVFLPSVVFMSVVIGGGYATGRELVEFFLRLGPTAALLGMALAALVWSVVFAASLEFARVTGSYDYRSFFRQLLGRGWILFEIVYLALLVLVLAVLGAATGEILRDLAGLPTWTGTTLFAALIVTLAWSGTAAIERFFSWWGGLLYVAYAVFFVLCVTSFGDAIAAALSAPAPPGATPGAWPASGLAYAAYNIAVVPALLYCARYQRSRRDSLVAGLLAGPVAMLPGMLFLVAMLAKYPEIVAAPIPLQVLLDALGARWLDVAMQIVIFGTLVQTGIGVVHGFNERLVGALAPRARSGAERRYRLGAACVLLLVSTVLAAKVGLIGLIARGYGYSGWAVLAVYVLPLLTLGLYRIARHGRAAPGGTAA